MVALVKCLEKNEDALQSCLSFCLCNGINRRGRYSESLGIFLGLHSISYGVRNNVDNILLVEVPN